MALDKISSLLTVSVLEGPRRVKILEFIYLRQHQLSHICLTAINFDRNSFIKFSFYEFMTEYCLGNRTELEVDVPCSVAYQCYLECENTPKWMPMISSVKVTFFLLNSLGHIH
jgi:hypothetical protein